MLAAFAANGTQTAPQPTGELIAVEGHRVHLYCTGKGTPTVMVMGGGFSFDWGLVQPGIAQFTRVCTYDPPGTAWSDPITSVVTPKCLKRVEQIHTLLTNASIDGPYVLVGYSIGGLLARRFAQAYPKEIVGMVIVDHAFTNPGGGNPGPGAAKAAGDSRPVLIFETPITMGIEDDRNFKKLPQRNQDLHAWAMSTQPVRPTAADAEECSAEVENATGKQAYPLGRMPLVVVSTANDSPGYANLQRELLSLSRNSRQIMAENSSHMVIVDEPDVIVRAIRQVADAVRTGAYLR